MTSDSKLRIDRLWNGRPAPAHARVGLSLSSRAQGSGRGLEVEFDAPLHDDPPPNAPAGRFDTLWEYEVVELFVANAKGEYLELEFGPHGHHLALRFEGERNCVDRQVVIEPRIECRAGRWRARCVVSPQCLPPDFDRFNAYAIYGVGEGRTYLAYSGRDGERPDFHALSTFVPLAQLGGC